MSCELSNKWSHRLARYVATCSFIKFFRLSWIWFSSRCQLQNEQVFASQHPQEEWLMEIVAQVIIIFSSYFLSNIVRDLLVNFRNINQRSPLLGTSGYFISMKFWIVANFRKLFPEDYNTWRKILSTIKQVVSLKNLNDCQWSSMLNPIL